MLALTKSRVIGGSWLGADIDLEPLQDFIRNSHGEHRRSPRPRLLADFRRPLGHVRLSRRLPAGPGWRWRRPPGLNDDEVTAEVEASRQRPIFGRPAARSGRAAPRELPAQRGRSSDTWGKAWAASRLPLLRWCRGDLARRRSGGGRAVAVASEYFDWAEASLATACRVAVAVAQGRLAQAERLGTLAHQQYLRSDYAWTLLVLAPALIAGRAYRGDVAGVNESISMIAEAGIDSPWPVLAGRAILGDAGGGAGRTRRPEPRRRSEVVLQPLRPRLRRPASRGVRRHRRRRPGSGRPLGPWRPPTAPASPKPGVGGVGA